MKHVKNITVFLLLALVFIFLAIIITCKKEKKVPSLTTENVSEISQTSAVSGGNVTDDGGAFVNTRGVCWNVSPNPTTGSNKTSDGTGVGTFTSNITGLTANTNYYLRAYAINSEGTNYGNEVSFTTSEIALATVTTDEVTSITTTGAVSGGSISADGGGTITVKGVCWSINENPTTADDKTTDGSGNGNFSSNISDLIPGTIYYIRAYVTNEAGIAYGNELSFFTPDEKSNIIFNPNLTYGTVNDIEGHIYKTIDIGTQTWMAENLRATRLNDKTQIPNVTDLSAWASLTSMGYCWNNNDPKSFKSIYGALYNWYVVGTNKICPEGWHVPSEEDWNILQAYLGGSNVAGGALKETGTTHWQNPNEDASNNSGFTALPGGQRDIINNFWNGTWIGVFGQWWTSTNESTGQYYDWELDYSSGQAFYGALSSSMGLSLRCVKN